MASDGCLMGIGNPLLDISAPVDEELLKKYGVELNNAILAEEKHKPIYPELAAMDTVEYIAGGATLNSIRVAQWMLQRENSTSYSGCIGEDEFGSLMKACVQKDGVKAYFQISKEEPTGTCAVLVHQKERSLIANLAAANKFTESHASTPDMAAAISRAKVFYMAGFFLTVSPPTIMHVCRHALAENKIVGMNLSAPFIPQFFGAPLAEALPFVDFMFANESEAAAYGAANKLEDTSVEAVAKHIAGLPKEKKEAVEGRTVVFTQGADETIVAQQKANGEVTVTRFPVEKLDPAAIVDLNGAGDAFVGGFWSQFVQQQPLEVCVRAGNYAARYIIQQSGVALSDKPSFTQ